MKLHCTNNWLSHNQHMHTHCDHMDEPSVKPYTYDHTDLLNINHVLCTCRSCGVCAIANIVGYKYNVSCFHIAY